MLSLNWIGKEKIITRGKGDYSDNAETADKLWLGKKWADLAGDNYKYFMVLQSKEVDGASLPRHSFNILIIFRSFYSCIEN